jgi:hypothetical protein
MLVSVFVDFLHVEAASPIGAYALAGSDVLVTSAPVRPPTDPPSCPACLWQRLVPRHTTHISLNLTRDAVRVLFVPLVAEWPDSPVPRPAAFRGPPRSTLA